MKKLLLAANLLLSVAMSAQIWSENFNSVSDLPAGWSQESAATDGGWSVNTPAGLSSTSFTIPASDGNILGTNDDGCDCDKSNDFIMTPSITLPAGEAAYLLFDYFYYNGTYQGATESLSLEISFDGGASWDVLQEVAGAGSWTSAAVNLTDFGGTTINLGFRYNDGGGWLYGVGLDNMEISSPDLTIVDAIVSDGGVGIFNPAIPTTSYNFTKYLTGGNVTPTIVVTNNAFSPITSFDALITVNGFEVVESVSGIELGYNESYLHEFASVQVAEGANSWSVAIENVNGGAETVTNNNGGAALSIQGVTPFPGRLVVGEYGTGTWCGWCVRSHTYTDYLSSVYPDNFVSIAVHNGDPMVVGEYDTAMGNAISGYPSGFVDRATFAGSAETDPSDFEAALLERVSNNPGVLVSADIDYTAGSSTATINCGFNFTNAVTGIIRVAVVLIEDEVSGSSADWDQANYYSGGGAGPMGGFENLSNPVDASDMTYNHVARAIYGTYAGQTGIITPNPAAGSSFTHQVTATVDPSWNMANMRAIAMVIKSGDILNAGMSGLGSVNVADVDNSATEFSVYPNPANNQAYIRLNNSIAGDVTITICDMTGKTVASKTYQNLSSDSVVSLNTSEYSNGLYIVRAEGAGSITTKSLVVNK
jgi:hypothetical protein